LSLTAETAILSSGDFVPVMDKAVRRARCWQDEDEA